MTRVGVFPLASERSSLTSPALHDLPLLRVYFAIAHLRGPQAYRAGCVAAAVPMTRQPAPSPRTAARGRAVGLVTEFRRTNGSPAAERVRAQLHWITLQRPDAFDEMI